MFVKTHNLKNPKIQWELNLPPNPSQSTPVALQTTGGFILRQLGVPATRWVCGIGPGDGSDPVWSTRSPGRESQKLKKNVQFLFKFWRNK